MNEHEFLEGLQGLQILPTTTVVHEYRVYYDSTGKVMQYTTGKPPGNYLVITAQEYAQCNPHAIVLNGSLIDPRKIQRTTLLTKNSEGNIRTSKYDVSVLVDDNEPEYELWKLTTYDD